VGKLFARLLEVQEGPLPPSYDAHVAVGLLLVPNILSMVVLPFVIIFVFSNAVPLDKMVSPGVILLEIAGGGVSYPTTKCQTISSAPCDF
jgi:hypothetical protein